MNGVGESDVDMPSTPESQYRAIYIQERSETQLYTVRTPETSKPKRWVSLGFLFDAPFMVQAESCVTF